MKIFKYTPSQFDATVEHISERISEYNDEIVFTVLRGESATAIIELEENADKSTLLTLDAAMASLGYYRQ